MSTIEAENTMRALQERELLRSMDEIVAKFKHYVETYETHDSQSTEMFIDDMLYGIGQSMSREYAFAKGYIKFKDRIKEKIDAEIPQRIKTNDTQ